MGMINFRGKKLESLSGSHTSYSQESENCISKLEIKKIWEDDLCYASYKLIYIYKKDSAVFVKNRL